MAFISVITLRRFTLIKVVDTVLYSNSNSSNGGLVKQYQGLSSKDLHRATFYTLCGLAEHKQYVKSKILDKPSGFHFNQPGHNLSHLSGLVLEQVRSEDPFVLRAREFLYIQKFDTYRNGLNKEP